MLKLMAKKIFTILRSYFFVYLNLQTFCFQCLSSFFIISNDKFCVNFRSNQDGETIVRTVSDCWVVGKKSDQREVFIVINQKNSNLIEVNGE